MADTNLQLYCTKYVILRYFGPLGEGMGSDDRMKRATCCHELWPGLCTPALFQSEGFALTSKASVK